MGQSHSRTLPSTYGFESKPGPISGEPEQGNKWNERTGGFEQTFLQIWRHAHRCWNSSANRMGIWSMTQQNSLTCKARGCCRSPSDEKTNTIINEKITLACRHAVDTIIQKWTMPGFLKHLWVTDHQHILIQLRALNKQRCNKYSKLRFDHRSSNRNVCKKTINPFEMSGQTLVTL